MTTYREKSHGVPPSLEKLEAIGDYWDGRISFSHVDPPTGYLMISLKHYIYKTLNGLMDSLSGIYLFNCFHVHTCNNKRSNEFEREPGGCGRSGMKEWEGEKLCSILYFIQNKSKNKLTSSPKSHVQICILILVSWVNQTYLPTNQINRLTT